MRKRPHGQLSEASKNPRPATERALQLLEAMATIGRPASLKEMAAMWSIPHATAFRLCQRLEQEGYLIREVGTRRYAIGVRLTRLGLNIVRASGPASARRGILSELVGELGETCNLTALVGTEVLYLDRVETQWPLRVMLEPGSRVPIHCTASGKLFLATMAAQTRDQILAELPLAAHTPNSIVDKRTLKQELTRIGKRGYSTDNEEFLIGLTAVAVPLKDQRGKTLAAVACHAPKARITLRQLVGKIDVLKRAAQRLAKTFEAD